MSLEDDTQTESQVVDSLELVDDIVPLIGTVTIEGGEVEADVRMAERHDFHSDFWRSIEAPTFVIPAVHARVGGVPAVQCS